MADLPRVLAGPVLRRVDARRVCVWMALSEPGDVTVTVFSGRAASTGPGTSDAPSVGTGTRGTRRFGAHLHVVVVDVECSGLPSLTRHSYDVVVGGAGLRDLGLLKDGTGTPAAVPLGYATDMLPGFVTPASDLADLRMAHTSCRKSNGPGAEALAWLDDRLQEGLSDVGRSVQMLFLTGDQIYADEVGAVLLPMLHELGRDMVGPEQLPVGGSLLAAEISRFPAMRRQDAVRALARFSTEAGHNHLLTYGEFCAMYCAAWSPSVWRALPSPDSLFTPPPADAGLTHVTAWESAFGGDTVRWKTEEDDSGTSALDRTTEEAAAVAAWRDAVPKVARALANVPTYMIFDDHEVTDDWNLTDRWRERVNTAPFGRAVVRNAVLAYTAFQGWGNDPQRFRHEGSVTEDQKDPNEKLLDRMTTFADGLAAPASATLDAVDELIGLDKPVTNPKVTFHYEVPGPMFSVRVLDTRTRRTYRAKGNAPPRLVGDSLDAQLPKGPFTDGRQLLVVVSAAPVLFPRIFESLLQPLAALAFDLKEHLSGRDDPKPPGVPAGLTGAEHKDIEGWRSDEEHHEKLLRRLGTYPRVVVLSGDVHFSSTLVMDFWGGGDDTRDARIVQCTSSAARNQPEEDMRGLLRTLRIGQQLLRGVPAERIAWEGTHGVVLPPGASIRPGRRARLRRKPAILPAQGWPAGTTTSSTPDWRWRLTVLRDERPRAALPAGAPDVPVLTWDAGDRVASYAALAASHQQVTLAPRDPVRLMVFRNNVGLVSFAADGADFSVAHTLLSSADDDTGAPYTEHRAPFAPSPPPPAPVLAAG